ncbi:MAG: NTP transferase domain-containing protein [Bacteroidaceae bacterium]|nr:NTP transferase domain-containing protein [Bacteroidaceae bacterium]
MKYGLIAAGQGSRLVADGITTPKPLIQVGGETLLGRLCRIFCENGAESISVIINEEMREVYDYIMKIKLPIPLNLVVKSTPDSFHSFCELMPFLQEKKVDTGVEYGKDGLDSNGKFCLTTIDPIFQEKEFASYIRRFQEDDEHDALMGVTDYIDDEKPLYVKTDAETLQITGYANESYEGCRFISGGIYCMNQQALALLLEAKEAGVQRMRGFQQYLVDAGLKLQAWAFSKVIDIDHAADIEVAERLLAK